MTRMFKQTRGLSVGFLLLLETFYFRGMKGKTFKVMMIHGAHSGCPAALEWQPPDLSTQLLEMLDCGKAVSTASSVNGGPRFPAVSLRLRDPISPMIREI